MLRSALVAFWLAGLLAAAPLTAPVPATAAAPHAARKTVAVLYFDNRTGRSDYDALGKGIASMMISDLSSVSQIQLVERDRLQDLVKEMDQQHTTYFDTTTAQKVGKLAGAEYVVVGSFATLRPQMRIDTRVVRVQTGEIVKSAQVTGKEDDFFELEQKLASRLVDGLGIALSPEEQRRLRDQQQANRVDHLATLVDFSNALTLYDRADYLSAAERMVPVVQAAPNAMFIRTAYDEMKRRGADAAKNRVKDRVRSGLGGLLRRP